MIALVVYHGPTGWGVPLSVEELIDVPPPLERFLPNRGEELIPTLAEQWANQGREQGLAEGIERGIERGALIGTIETCRSILGGSSGSEVLARQPLEELRQLAEQLQSQVRERMTGQ